MKTLRTLIDRFFPAEKAPPRKGDAKKGTAGKGGSRKGPAGKGGSTKGTAGKGDSRKAGIRAPKRRKANARPGRGMDQIPTPLRARAERWAQIWGVPGLPASVTLEFTRRLRSSLGNCRPAQSLIRLAAHLEEDNEDLLEEVLCHELAHVAVYRLYGPSVPPHGREWKSLLSAAGFEPRVRFQPGEGRFPPRGISSRRPGSTPRRAGRR